ncbi:uncharacterized protein LOC106414526 [Brassica napus]|uniref:uncharacterized protein LOC106414526 n=1 Tax=Brassica napus TaxID=3708 RepID=UPI0006AB2D4E|nr:uncharacterized protein LOC106414526 [Brassica napus]
MSLRTRKIRRFSSRPKQECDLINGQIQASEGFDVDWTKARCLYNYHPVEFDDDEFVEEPETNLDLLNRLCEKSIGHYNQENKTAYELVKPLYANFHGTIGIMFLITFQVKDPVENLTKDFQARIHYSYCSKSQFIMCRPKHHQADSLGVAENDPKKPKTGVGCSLYL